MARMTEFAQLVQASLQRLTPQSIMALDAPRDPKAAAGLGDMAQRQQEEIDWQRERRQRRQDAMAAQQAAPAPEQAAPPPIEPYAEPVMGPAEAAAQAAEENRAKQMGGPQQQPIPPAGLEGPPPGINAEPTPPPPPKDESPLDAQLRTLMQIPTTPQGLGGSLSGPAQGAGPAGEPPPDVSAPPGGQGPGMPEAPQQLPQQGLDAPPGQTPGAAGGQPPGRPLSAIEAAAARMRERDRLLQMQAPPREDTLTNPIPPPGMEGSPPFPPPTPESAGLPGAPPMTPAEVEAGGITPARQFGPDMSDLPPPDAGIPIRGRGAPGPEVKKYIDPHQRPGEGAGRGGDAPSVINAEDAVAPDRPFEMPDWIGDALKPSGRGGTQNTPEARARADEERRKKEEKRRKEAEDREKHITELTGRDTSISPPGQPRKTDPVAEPGAVEPPSDGGLPEIARPPRRMTDPSSGLPTGGLPLRADPVESGPTKKVPTPPDGYVLENPGATAGRAMQGMPYSTPAERTQAGPQPTEAGLPSVPSPSTRQTGSSGKPSATETVETANKLNIVQRMADKYFGVDTPEERSRAKTFLTHWGATLATSTAGWGSIAEANLAGMKGVQEEELRQLGIDLKRDENEMRHDEVAYNRSRDRKNDERQAGLDAVERDKNGLIIDKYQREAKADREKAARDAANPYFGGPLAGGYNDKERQLAIIFRQAHPDITAAELQDMVDAAMAEESTKSNSDSWMDGLADKVAARTGA